MLDHYTTNPIVMIYTELWKILADRPEISGLIEEGNRIRFDETRDPTKRTTSTADYPELIIAPETVIGNLKSSSSSSSFVFRYGVVTSTGDFRYTTFLAQVQWILLGVLVDWRNTLGCLNWCGENFVKGVRLESDALGFTDVDPVVEVNRKRGWSSLMRFDVETAFKTSNVAKILTSEN